jgi:Uma2 family endonuclease
MVVQTRTTANEFLALPESNLPTELLDGEIIMSPAPELDHQDIAGRLYILIKTLAPGGQAYFAPVDVYLDESNVVQPDVLWIAEGSACVPVEGKYLRGAPDLVAEVLSPGTALRDKRDKFRLYEKYGVREYWMIDPGERLLEVWQLKEGRLARLDVFGPREQFTSLLGAVDTKTIFPE